MKRRKPRKLLANKLAPGWEISQTLHQYYKVQLREVFGQRCWYCGRELTKASEHLDHIKPRAKGGLNEAENLALICEFCNRSKWTKSIEEYYNWLKHIRSDYFHRFYNYKHPHPLSNLWQKFNIKSDYDNRSDSNNFGGTD